MGHKIKPKDFFGKLKEHERYIMVTNRNLYTLDGKAFEDGQMDKDKLVINVIAIEFLSHLIFFPEFDFEPYKKDFDFENNEYNHQ